MTDCCLPACLTAVVLKVDQVDVSVRVHLHLQADKPTDRPIMDDSVSHGLFLLAEGQVDEEAGRTVK